MSSVLGLKVRPSSAICLAAHVTAQCLETLRAMARLRASFTATTVSTMRSGASWSCAGLQQRERVLGKARSAIARPGMQELRADAVVEADAARDSCTSAPTLSQRSAISLMKVILVARNALAAYLINSAVRRR